MVLKGQYRVKYILDKKLNELVVEVVLKQYDGLVPPGRNIYYGVATVNGSAYNHNDLSSCVNAQYCAESIGTKLIDEYKTKAKSEGKLFRLKNK